MSTVDKGVDKGVDIATVEKRREEKRRGTYL